MLIRRLLLLFAAGAGCATAWSAPQDGASAQTPSEEDGNELLELRVTHVRGTSLVVDRGANDLVRVGDRVFFRPREGGLQPGVVTQTDERTAIVELQTAGFEAAPGLRGFVRIPNSRVPAAPVRARRKPRANAVGEGVADTKWSNPDEEYRQGQPLLARVRPVRPEERPSEYSGRWYTTVDQIRSTEDDRTDAFYRVGGGLRIENFSGRGDRVQIDGELNYRNTDVPDDDDQRATRFRLDRFSYSWGGTRFDPTRVELGRFLHSGMPEFGVLDGAEWTTRTSGGDRYGVALGYLPEPDLDYETGRDFALSAFYRWVQDESERLSASVGFQKSWHDSNADRDLAVLNVSYLPDDGWSVISSAWIDIYTGSDGLKDRGPELTQALVNVSRQLGADTLVGLRVSHIALPQLQRQEYVVPQPLDFVDAHVDRASVFARTDLSPRTRVRAEAGIWSDEEDSGGNAEAGVELSELLFEGSLLGLAAFGVNGQFSDAIGGRGYLRDWGPSGGWSLEYELANNDLVGFTSQNDDLPQHRIRVQWDHVSIEGWSVRLSLDTQLWDSEHSLLGSLHVNRSF